MAADNKVLVIGLDGATFDLIDPWIEQGKLPTLAGCIKRGVRSDLRSTPLSNSAQAWSSFITGKNPGKHGIYDFFQPLTENYGVRFINASFRQGKSLWRIVSDAGKSVGVINVPITYPAEEVKGFMIPGLDSPGISQDFAYPPELIKEIGEKVGEYILEPGIWGFIRKGQYDIALAKLLETIDMRTATAKYLMTSRKWDLFTVVYTSSDKVQHHFWKFIDPARAESSAAHSDAIFQVYKRLDNSIKQLLEAVDDSTQVFIMSDHGAGPSTNKSMFINHWLGQEGFLCYENGQLNRGLRKVKYRLIQHADRLVKKRLSRKTKEWMLRRFPGVRNQVSSALSLPGIDWSKTAAYSRENHPAIYVNLKGREAQGTVSPGQEYEAVCQSIIDKLLVLKCPESGKNIVDSAFCSNEVYHGFQKFRAPDIIFSWKDYNYVHRPSPINSDSFLKIFTPDELAFSENLERPSGIHRDYGIFVSTGSNIKKSRQISTANITDIAPTILHLLNIAIPDDMDGQVLLEIFEEDFRKRHQPEYSKSTEAFAAAAASSQDYLDGEAEAVKERLKGLGYID